MENQQPTESEIKAFEEKMTLHYQNKLPFLRLKAEFDMLNADIAEARIRSIQANNAFYQAMAQQDSEKNKSETDPVKDSNKKD